MESYDNDGLLLAMDDDLFPIETENIECGSVYYFPMIASGCSIREFTAT